MNARMLRLAVLAAAGSLFLADAGETRYHQYTKRFMNPNDPATPVAAGYFGGSADEYLSGGAVLADGTVLLAGTCYGNAFDPEGVRVRVLGTDGAAPEFTMPTRTKKGRTKLQPPDWSHVDGAGFVVRLTEDYGGIADVIRFPWGSGSVTDIAGGPGGEILVAGICGPGFAKLTAATALAPEGEPTGEDDIFIGRLADDLSGFAWCRILKDTRQAAPKIKVIGDGRITLIGQHAHRLTADGELLEVGRLEMTNNWVRGVDPVSLALAKGGDSNTNTGWEPWRQPVLFVVDKHGEHTDTFYRWSPKLVGTNWSRLVSDSDIRGLNYDREGNLLVVGWSDGGNSVLEYLPYDLKTGVYGAVKRRTGRKCGLGFSTWGVGASSICHLIKLDPQTGEPLAKTLFLSYLGSKNKPNGLGVHSIDTAPDNSVLLGGGSAWGLIETGSLKVNSMTPEEDYMGGPFIAVLNGAMSDIRFCSALPGAGQVPIITHSKKQSGEIGMGSGRVGDKVVSVFVTAAKEDGKFTPVNNAQKAFGGGSIDGQYVILEMDPDQPRDEVEVADGEGKKKKKKNKKGKDLTGTFRVERDMNRDWCVLVMRDRGGDLWPAFYLCHPEGSGSVDASGGGSFTILGGAEDVQLTSGSRQDVRIGGKLSRLETYEDNKGRERSRRVYPELRLAITITGEDSCDATIAYNGETIEVKGSCSIRPSKPTGKGINVSGRFTTTKGELGLAEGDAADHEVTIDFWAPGRP